MSLRAKHNNLCAQTPNTIVVRPFKVVQSGHCTRLKPRTTPFFGDCYAIILSPGERELEGGGYHPHLNPLPSREKTL